MPKPSLVIVLVEDDHHEMLVRRYLRRKGLKPHQMRIERSPSGVGSGEQWVKMRFAKEVIAYRGRRNKAATALITILDADNHAVHERLTQLSSGLSERGMAPVASTEDIVRLVPKRNVETWILCLNEHAVDEETDYKRTRDDWGDLIPGAAETLFRWVGAGDAGIERCIDSLRRGVEELKRLTF